MSIVGSSAAAIRLRRAYYTFQATANLTCFGAVFFVYYGSRIGLSVAAILWLQAYFTTVRAILDVPLGALADRYSRRRCLIAGNLFLALGSIGLVLWPTVLMAIAAETAFAVSSALRSGADAAFLYDALAVAGATDQYPRAESRGQAVAAIAAGTAAVVGGLLATVDLRLPYVATIVAALGGTIVALGFPEARSPDPRGRDARTLIHEAGRVVWGRRDVQWTMALATLAVVASHVYFFLQQPYLSQLGVPVAFFGMVVAATKVVTAIVANVAHHVDARTGRRGVALTMTAVPALGLGAMAVATTPLGGALLLSRGVLDGLWQPLANVYLNRLVPSHLRATLLSLQSLVARLTLAAALGLLGIATSHLGLSATLLVVAVLTAAVGALLVGLMPRGLLRSESVIPEMG